MNNSKKLRFHIITIGCQMNKSDSERIAGFLKSLGYSPADDPMRAGLVIFTTCGVRQSAEDRVYGLAPAIRKKNPEARIVLTGCLAYREDVKKRLADSTDLFIPISRITELAGWLSGKKFLARKPRALNCRYLKIRPQYRSNFIASVPIGNGCNNFCSYCVVPYARGRETYRPFSEIIREVKILVNNGYKDISLIAQNVNSYRDPVKAEYDFPRLLEAVDAILGNFWIRFITSHPKDMSDRLIDVIGRSKKVCRQIHLAAQSGDNAILKSMNRNYTAGHFSGLVGKLRKKAGRPGLPVSISTDIIVGFPGETHARFMNTRRLFARLGFDQAYIACYSPRPGTAAARLKDSVSRAEKKKREEALVKILKRTALAHNKKYLGKTVDVLVEGKNKHGQWYGKTETNKAVKFFSAGRPGNLTGNFSRVKITKARDFGLEGQLSPETRS